MSAELARHCSVSVIANATGISFGDAQHEYCIAPSGEYYPVVSIAASTGHAISDTFHDCMTMAMDYMCDAYYPKTGSGFNPLWPILIIGAPVLLCVLCVLRNCSHHCCQNGGYNGGDTYATRRFDSDSVHSGGHLSSWGGVYNGHSSGWGGDSGGHSSRD